MPGVPDWLWRGPVIPVILLLAAAAIIVATWRGAAPRSQAPSQVPNEVWTCRACAKASGKAWIPCRSVTGRGNEKGARDRIKQVVCDEAGVPVEDCELTNLTCTRLEGPDAGAPAPSRSE